MDTPNSLGVGGPVLALYLLRGSQGQGFLLLKGDWSPQHNHLWILVTGGAFSWEVRIGCGVSWLRGTIQDQGHVEQI